MKFIDGLPSQLAFYVRAGHPVNLQAALSSAKMGEAYGYRSSTLPFLNHVNAVSDVAAKASRSEDLDGLRADVRRLAGAVEAMMVKDEPRRSHVERSSGGTRCYKCKAEGHLQKNCNFNGDGGPRPDFVCNLCRQKGHSASRCKINAQTPKND